MFRGLDEIEEKISRPIWAKLRYVLFDFPSSVVIKKFLFIQLTIAALACSGQNQKNLVLDGVQVETWQHKDTLALVKKATHMVSEFWSSGYLFAGVDSVNYTSIYIHKGDRLDLQVYNSSVYLPELLKIANKEIQAKHNDGYPFATLKWDSIRLTNNFLTLKKVIDLGPYIEYDSIILLSPIKTKRDFIAKTLGMIDGKPFNESTFLSITDRLKQVSFFENKQEPDVSFQGGKAWTYLNLKENKTGSFEGILGVLPNQSTDRSALITGNLNLGLLNLFGSGKEFDFSWQRFGEESQLLDLSYKHPFFLSSNIHVQGAFGLVKQDTSFVTQNFQFITSFFLQDQLEIGLILDQSTGTVLSTDSRRISNRNLQDFRQNVYSISLSRIEKITQAKKGLSFISKIGVGERNISINPNLPIESYDTIDLKVTNLITEVGVEFQTMVSRRSGIHGDLSLAYQSTAQPISNQFFRLGGLETLRGFNEQFFFASSYIVSQLEWRLYFEERSFFFGFYDQGFLKNEKWVLPAGLGGGFSLNTKAGLLSFALAVGKTKDVPFEFTNMKVHFGYLSRF